MSRPGRFRYSICATRTLTSPRAGYCIDKGKLSIETTHRVEERRLAAEHRFVVNQLQLGERVESPNAVSLPLKLAVALLKNRNGVIDIDLPVRGTLDDPKFRLGPIIWKVVVNLLLKIVTSPFTLLGNLFGGGQGGGTEAGAGRTARVESRPTIDARPGERSARAHGVA